jgi:hypothetical protein
MLRRASIRAGGLRRPDWLAALSLESLRKLVQEPIKYPDHSHLRASETAQEASMVQGVPQVDPAPLAQA